MLSSSLQKGLEFPVELVRDAWRRYVALRSVRLENEALHDRIVELEEENAQLREVLLESRHLESLVRNRRERDAPVQPAQVVGQDFSPWFRSLLLDRGRQDGAHSGMPVMTDGGLVGLVTAAAPLAARVTLLLDERSAVDGIAQRSRARGIVRGSGGGGLDFEFYSRDADVQTGDLVITSGLGGVYPKGLRIGHVTEVTADPDLLVHRAALRPTVDFRRVEQVFVLLWRSPTFDLLEAGTAAAPGGGEAGAPQSPNR